MRRIFVCCVLALFAFSFASAETTKVGSITKVEGDVFVKTKDALTPVSADLKEPLPVAEGTTLLTKKGTAKLNYLDGSTLELKSNSYCVVSKTTLILLRGTLAFEVREKDVTKIDIVTPSKKSSIKGEKGIVGNVKVDLEGDEYFSLSEGLLAMSMPLNQELKVALAELAPEVVALSAGDEDDAVASIEDDLIGYIVQGALELGVSGEPKPASPFKPY